MFCAITSPVEDATTDLGDMLVPPTVFISLSRAGFAETREADAELVPTDGIRAPINRNTNAVRVILGIIERNIARWYQREFIISVPMMNRWGSGWGFSKRLEREAQLRGTTTQLSGMHRPYLWSIRSRWKDLFCGRRTHSVPSVQDAPTLREPFVRCSHLRGEDPFV